MSAEHDAQLHMIGESAADFAARHRGVAHEGAAAWKSIAGLGWFGIAVPESHGGLALGAPAVAVVAEPAGHTLMRAPIGMGMAAAQVLAGAQGGDDVLAALLAGDACIALAPATAVTGGTLLATLVSDGDAAAQWLVAVGEGAGFSARLLRVGEPGVVRDDRAAVDGSRLADLRIDHAAWADALRLLSGADGEATWRRGVQLGWLSDAAYLCGLMDAALKLALDHLRLRRQFGVPIGSFQALQHRAVACHVDVTATRALVHEAARAFGTPRQAWAAAAAVHRAGEAALRVTLEVVQFHGAIGFADEHDAGRYLRRAMTLGARHTADALAVLQGGVAGG